MLFFTSELMMTAPDQNGRFRQQCPFKIIVNKITGDRFYSNYAVLSNDRTGGEQGFDMFNQL